MKSRPLAFKLLRYVIGCGVLVVGFVLLGQLVHDYGTHMNRIIVCRSNRKELLRLEASYRQIDLKHRYTTDLAALPTNNGQVPPWLRCPDGGRYQVVLDGGQIKITCSVPDHAPVSE